MGVVDAQLHLNTIRTMISTLDPRQGMRYDGLFDILARNDTAHARDNGWMGKRGSQHHKKV